jgi:hypothetical protein
MPSCVHQIAHGKTTVTMPCDEEQLPAHHTSVQLPNWLARSAQLVTVIMASTTYNTI